MRLSNDDIQTAIFTTLAAHVPNAALDHFQAGARLNADLALDSIMLLELLVHLELDFGLSVPEDAVVGDRLERVSDLVTLLRQWQPEATA